MASNPFAATIIQQIQATADPNPGTTQPHYGPLSVTLNPVKSQSGINQIRGADVKGSTSYGIPKQVTNVGVAVSQAATGSTSKVVVTFHRDPSDKAYSATAIWVKGYQGNNNPVQVGSSFESPATVILNNTGEPVTVIAQATGNGGQAPLSSAPTSGLRLPKSTVSGYGTSTTVAYTPASPPPSSGVSFSTSGQGWFIGPGILDFACTINGFDAPITNRSANVVVAQQFVLNSPWTLSKVSYKLHLGSAATNFNFGIYDANGNKLIDSGAFDGSLTTVQTKSFTPVTLPAGVYYFACSETSNTPTGPAIQIGSTVVGDFLAGITAVNPLVGTAANATSANVLPSTLGVITAATSAWYQSIPLCVWQV